MKGLLTRYAMVLAVLCLLAALPSQAQPPGPTPQASPSATPPAPGANTTPTSPTRKEEKKGVRVRAKLDTIYASNSLSGPGAADPINRGLYTYDFSLHEFALAGGQAVTRLGTQPRVMQVTNYSRVYPGDSTATNLRLGLEATLGRGWKMTTMGEFYQRGGNPRVAQNWGPHIPNFHSTSDSFVADFLKLDVEKRNAATTWRLVTGDFYPEYSVQRHSRVSTANFVLRGFGEPSWFRNSGHDSFEGYAADYTWRGRQDFRGVDLQVEDKQWHGEIFKATDDRPGLVPLAGLAGVRTASRDLAGAHAGIRSGPLESDLIWISSTGDRLAISREWQHQWALNASWKFCEEATIYGIISNTDYHRSTSAPVYSGAGWMAGIGGKVGLLDARNATEYAVEYKHVSPNYDPMGFHKNEHYPSNYSGVWLRLVQRFPNGRVLLSYLTHRQLNPAMTPLGSVDANLDVFFNVPGNTRPGTVSTFSADGQYRVPGWPLAFTLGYENARHRLSSSVADVQKMVDQWYAGVRVPLATGFWLDLTGHDFHIGGHWNQPASTTAQTVSYAVHQVVPRIGVNWQWARDSRLWIQYSPMQYRDSSVVNGLPTAGVADWNNRQWLIELKAGL